MFLQGSPCLSNVHTGAVFAWYHGSCLAAFPATLSPLFTFPLPLPLPSSLPLQRRHSLFGSSYQSWSCFSRNLMKRKQSRWKSSNRSEFTLHTSSSLCTHQHSPPPLHHFPTRRLTWPHNPTPPSPTPHSLIIITTLLIASHSISTSLTSYSVSSCTVVSFPALTALSPRFSDFPACNLPFILDEFSLLSPIFSLYAPLPPPHSHLQSHTSPHPLQPLPLPLST